MDLSKITNEELITRTDKLIKSERKITHLILIHINEFQKRRLYAELGFDSMFKYLTQHLGYSEDSAYRRLQAAKLINKNTDIIITQKLEQGSVNLTQLSQLQKCIQNHERSKGKKIETLRVNKILSQLDQKNSLETQKILAKEFDVRVESQSKLTAQADDSIRLQITLTAEQFQTLKEAKQILSHSIPDGDWANLISTLAKNCIQKNRGINKLTQDFLAEQKSETVQHQTSDAAKVSIKDTEDSAQPEISIIKQVNRSRRIYLGKSLKLQLLAQANHCCEYQSPLTGRRCQSRYQLQIDHKTPLARGGSNSESNLRILCRTHNLAEARRWDLN